MPPFIKTTRKKTRKLFEDFWRLLPDDARIQKSGLLGAHAIREMMEILTVHLQSLQAQLKEFDNVVSEIAYDMASQLSNREEEIEGRSKTLLEKTRVDALDRLLRLQEKWIERICRCETKFHIRKEWEHLQKDMVTAYQHNANLTSMDLELGIRQVAGHLWQGNGELEIDGSNLLTYDDEEVAINDDDEEEKTWLWTAGGAAAGAALGVALTGGIAIPLLLAAGAGGIAQIILSPLAVVKENLQKKIILSIKKEEEGICEQLEKIAPEIIDKIIEAAENEIQREIERRERAARQSKEDQINNIQRLWNNLFEARQILLRTNQQHIAKST